MDDADRIVQRQAKMTPSKVDPLVGYDLVAEYNRIKSNKSTLHVRIRDMIKDRMEYGR